MDVYYTHLYRKHIVDILYEKTSLCVKYSVIGCVCVIVLSFSLLAEKMKPGPGTQVLQPGTRFLKRVMAANTSCNMSS